ncbi:hypothetical protein EK904_005871 [Melospiza melodia maxima]|nr:hypothetical protein EK904_005871 [Melospiza melodia maxima]
MMWRVASKDRQESVLQCPSLLTPPLEAWDPSVARVASSQPSVLCGVRCIFSPIHSDSDSGSQFLRHDQRSFIILLLVKQRQSLLPSYISMVLAEPQLRNPELHRHESIQEKNVKEAKTKCRTIASLLTDAPNPHSKGVLMFKKRRQRAKKYTLVSFGSVDEDRSYEEEDGIFPTSESEFDEEGFSDARSLTNHSDWDNTYLDIEKSKSDSEQKEEKQKGLSEASDRSSLILPVCPVHLCVHTHMHTATLSREGKDKWGLTWDISPRIPSVGCTFLVALKHIMSMLGREEDRAYTSLGTLSTVGEDLPILERSLKPENSKVPSGDIYHEQSYPVEGGCAAKSTAGVCVAHREDQAVPLEQTYSFHGH